MDRLRLYLHLNRNEILILVNYHYFYHIWPKFTTIYHWLPKNYHNLPQCLPLWDVTHRSVCLIELLRTITYFRPWNIGCKQKFNQQFNQLFIILIFHNSLFLSFSHKNHHRLVEYSWNFWQRYSTYRLIDFIFMVPATKNPIDKFLTSSHACFWLAINFCCHFQWLFMVSV